MLEKIDVSPACGLYRMAGKKDAAIERIIATTPETRAIANDPRVMGIDYTRRLQQACSHVLNALSVNGLTCLEETETIVFNILRGGLNFGLREALGDAFGWNCHGSSFISAQRARDDDSPEQWHIVEGDYSKVYMPNRASIVIGDVVATGTSLEHAMKALVAEAENQGADLRSVVFFTIGSPRAAEILAATDAMCRKRFPGFEKTVLVYLEGCFAVPAPETRLSIKITGTDLLRLNAVMAPEFVASQYEDPAYPIQRCTIYDAGSRAFWTPEYLADLEDYWTRVREIAGSGVSYRAFLEERFPELDADRFGDVDLGKVSDEELAWIKGFTQ
ncbi:MAG: phosphoribosyltransferase [Desulfobacter sp.]|nr:MAG: phosphoribosyltransferase [Desulfobacter sp.]